MKERPILFSAPMVRAILDGSKTQTRRIVKSQSNICCPFGKPGDRLWVRETFQGPLFDSDNSKCCVYRADGGEAPEYVDADDNLRQGWKPSIFMPRWASRITLEITGVRVERLQDISASDCYAEGCFRPDQLKSLGSEVTTRDNARGAYRKLWESINGADSWDANPWVWVVEFKAIDEFDKGLS